MIKYMQYKHSFGFYKLIWLSEKWIALSQVIRDQKIDQGTWSMCSWSSIKSFGCSDHQFSEGDKRQTMWASIQQADTTTQPHLHTKPCKPACLVCHTVT